MVHNERPAKTRAPSNDQMDERRICFLCFEFDMAFFILDPVYVAAIWIHHRNMRIW